MEQERSGASAEAEANVHIDSEVDLPSTQISYYFPSSLRAALGLDFTHSNWFIKSCLFVLGMT